jgi:hypothetical protein
MRNLDASEGPARIPATCPEAARPWRRARRASRGRPRRDAGGRLTPVLDTDFLIALDTQEPAALALLEELKDETLLVPDIVAVEDLTPFGDRAADAHNELARPFTLAPTSRDWVLAATRLRERLRREAMGIPSRGW